MYSVLSNFADTLILTNNWLGFVLVLIVTVLVVFIKSDILPTLIIQKEKTKRHGQSLRKKEQKKHHKD